MPEIDTPSLRDLPDIWDEKNPEVRLIAQRYELYLLKKWDNDRVTKLARSKGISLWILMAEAGVFREVWDEKWATYRLKLDVMLIRKCWKEDHWPAWILINLERLERYEKMRISPEQPNRVIMGIADKVNVQLTTKYGRH